MTILPLLSQQKSRTPICPSCKSSPRGGRNKKSRPGATNTRAGHEVLINFHIHQYLYFTFFYGKKGVSFFLRKKPTRKDNRYEYKLTLGRDIHGKPLRKSFYSTVSLSDAKKKAEEYRVASEVSARTGEAFVPSTYKQPFVDVNTYELTYVSLVEGHLIPYFGAARLSDIRPADIQAYFATKTECSESRLKK